MSDFIRYEASDGNKGWVRVSDISHIEYSEDAVMMMASGTPVGLKIEDSPEDTATDFLLSIISAGGSSNSVKPSFWD